MPSPDPGEGGAARSPTPARRRVVTLYGAPDCHLCHTAAVKLRRVSAVLRFDVTEVDVRADPALAARFGLVIPVVAVGDRVVLVSKVTEFRLLRLLPALLG